jgi:hypothetical protein
LVAVRAEKKLTPGGLARFFGQNFYNEGDPQS